MNRRQFLALAAALGAASAWASARPQASRVSAQERRELYPEGVASGDPDANSVFLWTRRPFASGTKARLRVEVSQDAAFSKVIATASANVLAAADWTCRVLVGNLKPSSVYWYRFIDDEGNASRVGRTITAPADNDRRPIKFAFVSCQNINTGALNAYRRMIHEDERAPEAERLGFVLHLGDFIYEVVWYPEDRPQGYYDRRIRDILRYPNGEKVNDLHIPTTVEDYRTVYRAYLHDPDLQDARARWPFVCMWDNHEFSQAGWQSVQLFNGQNTPVQTRKLAANQAWFEYQPARIVKSSGADLEQFGAPEVHDAPIARFDENGFGDEPNNRKAVESLQGYRALRWGRHLDLIITDQWSYRSQSPQFQPEAKALSSEDFPQFVPEEAMQILDAGRAYGGNEPPATIRVGDREIPNYRKDSPPQTLLGAPQKKWFIDRLKASQATWKIWGASLGTLEYRTDLQNLDASSPKRWHGAGFAAGATRDHSSAFVERAEIYAAVRDAKITGFASVSGDRHSFWAGYAAPALPPQPFAPVGLAFVTGSISMAGLLENLEYTLPKKHPLRPLYLADRAGAPKPEHTYNLLLHHGVRSALEYARSGDIQRARALSNRDLAPHLAFVDAGAHGYSTVRLDDKALECEFVAIPRPLERSDRPDGGPLLYRVVHRAPLWRGGEPPRMEQRVLEGDPKLSL